MCLTAIMMVFSMSAYALDKKEGVYQIGTADDLIAFAELVNGGEASANAVLTADIDKGIDGTMIGKDGVDYQGTFDGQGHTITINMFSAGEDGTALFRNIGRRAFIQNLKVQGTITTDKKYAAGIAAWSRGTIRGCYVDLTVQSSISGDATHGGIAGVAYQGTIVENCLAKFVITGATTNNCGGLVGWASDHINIINSLAITDDSSFDLSNNGSNAISRNNGNLGVVNLNEYVGNEYEKRPSGACYNNFATQNWGSNNATTIVAYGDLADGQVCYQLNNDQSEIAWVQQIGKDPFPVPAAFGTGQVYASGATGCDGKSEGELTYSNSGSVNAEAHEYDKYGICSVCGKFNTKCLQRDASDGYYLIGSAEDIDLAEGFNRIQNGGQFSLKMTNDIEYIAEPGRFIFNNSNWFDGNFNGQGHTLTIEMTDMTENNASLFPNFGGTFENVVMHGSISTSGQFAGSISGETRRGTMKAINVFSDIEINANRSDDNTTGGFFGVTRETTRVDNCIYAGDINGIEGTECIAGFVGWGGAQTYLTNCAFIGNLNNANGDSKTISRNPSNVTSDNVYSLNDYGFDDFGKWTLFENPDGIGSGELAYYLNGKVGGVERFYQKIGTDLYPLPIKKEGALVYASASSYRCDGQPEGSTVYTNTNPGTIVLPAHQYDEGFCSVCGQIQEDFITPVDGWFEISNGAELLWWATYAALGHLDANARLTSDIDMSDYSERWPDVGTRERPFYGNFDGQFHIISNFNINKPGADGVGLIGVMNSQPSSGFGGLSDSEARAAEGVYIKNVVLDESCSLLGHGYIGLVGMTAPWAGHVNIQGVMMCGDVTANGGVNASGVFGCVMNSSCHVTIDNCGMVGNVYGPTENGSFSGWLGDYAEVTNCFAVGSVEGIQDDAHYFARYGNATFTNCYARYGTQVPTVTEEDFESGALAWRANGKQFRTAYWYQNIGEDMYPFPDPSHGTVIYAAEQYFGVSNASELAEVAAEIQSYEETTVEETIATQSLIEEFKAKLKALDDATTILEFADAVDSVNVKKSALTANAAIYKTYIDKCEEIKATLEKDNSFSGSQREALEYYLNELEEESEENPLGTYEYIKENHTATGQEIEAETERVIKWLATAIAEDYAPGSDISNLLANYDFSQGSSKGWTIGYGSVGGSGTVQSGDPELDKYIGVEAWATTVDISQTLEDMKPGYYLVSTHAAFRPNDNRYSYNYGAGLYANGTFNFFPTVFEDYVPVDDALDRVNCYLSGNDALDLKIYDDNISKNDEEAESTGATLLGYAVHGFRGMAAVANAGRYPVSTIALVGEDGKLTIGLQNPGSNYGNDWTGWSAVKVTYCGGNDDNEAAEGLATALENQLARANTILNFYLSSPEDIDVTEAGPAPNYPAELKADLEAAVAEAESAETPEQKYASIQKLSQIFQDIYAAKQAYLKIADDAQAAEFALTLIDQIISESEYDTILNGIYDIQGAYTEGTISLEKALSFNISKEIPALAKIVAPKDENGTYQIGAPMQLIYFNAIVSNGNQKANAVLTNDINMAGIPFTPIALGTRYNGVFDGQGYAITNLSIGSEEEYCSYENAALFNDIEEGTVKNLKIQSEIYTYAKFAAGIAGHTRKAKIQDCDVDVTVHSQVEGDGTHGGIAGVNETEGTVVENCKVHFVLDGENTNSWGGVFGWSSGTDEVKNSIIIADVVAADLSSSNSISRNSGNCTTSNVYFTTKLNEDNIGTYIELADERFKTGELAWILNGSQAEEPHWFQRIGTEDMPHLFGGGIVWKNGNEYQNSRPNLQLNAFASNLSTATNADQVVVAYTLNAEAKSAAINFYAGSELKYSHVLKGGDLFAGGHEIAIDNSLLGVAAGTEMTYELDVTAMGVTAPTKIGDGYKVNSPYGLAVNNAPSSKGFGQIYVAESRSLEQSEGTICEQKPGALFAFDATFQPINAVDGTPGFYGGLDIKDNKNVLTISGGYQFDLKNVRVSKDGRLFIARASGNSTSSVWEADPADLDKPWTPVFTGGELDAATGIVTVGGEEQNRPAVALAVEGEGANLKLTVLGAQRSDGEENFSDYKCFTYNLGTAKEWTGAPSSVFEPLTGKYTISPAHVGIVADNRGGLWYEQHRDNPKEAEPAIKHFDATGNDDYTDITTATHGEAIAISDDGSILAIPRGGGKVVIYETNYAPMPNGQIFLEAKYNLNVTEDKITGMAFDYANNLYITSSSSKTLNRYAVPSFTENKTVTPCAEGFTVGTESGDPDAIANVNGNGNANSGAIYNISGQRVSKAQKGIYVVDGKKVSVK